MWAYKNLLTSVLLGLGNWTKNQEMLILFPPLSPFGQIAALFCLNFSHQVSSQLLSRMMGAENFVSLSTALYLTGLNKTWNYSLVSVITRKEGGMYNQPKCNYTACIIMHVCIIQHIKILK